MGNPKQKWTSEEEEALRAGVAKHGTGKWKNIQKDPEFNHFLYSRSNIDLKDKWRNMSVSANSQGSREKSRTTKAKANPDAPATPLPNAPTSTSITPAANGASADAVMDDSSKCLLDGKTASKLYNAMIYEALSTLKDPNGSDTSAIVGFIEQRHEVPQNFRRLLSSRLRRLVAQDKLEKGREICISLWEESCCEMSQVIDYKLKQCLEIAWGWLHEVQNCYKIKRDVLVVAKTPTPKPKDTIRPRQSQTTGYLGDTVEEAAVGAAYKVAEAENKSFVAAEAVKEAERVSRMAEDTDSLLQLAKEIFEKCNSENVLCPMCLFGLFAW
ncbi:unnamed protein product [Camellia sinensis]